MAKYLEVISRVSPNMVLRRRLGKNGKWKQGAGKYGTGGDVKNGRVDEEREEGRRMKGEEKQYSPIISAGSVDRIRTL